MELTKRELEVLTYVMQGIPSREVADILFLSKRTVDFHISNVYVKLDVKNRVQALHKANKLGLLADEATQTLYYR